MPEIEIVKMPEVEVVRQAFFEKVLTIHNPYNSNEPVYRFVAWAKKLDEEYGEAKILAIWNPNDHRDKPYNLVLSLVSDGKHYPLIDWDLPDKPEANSNGLAGSSQNIWFRSSSGNWHGYCNGYAASFSLACRVAEQPVVDGTPNKYAEHVRKQGYAALRPPWMPKIGKKFPWLTVPLDVLPEGFLDGLTPSEPERDAWEELFND
jgi:hypothetical protein